eukprot:COSAG04_NODE_11316_length_716_cov_0.752427_1_plen_46_part_01
MLLSGPGPCWLLLSAVMLRGGALLLLALAGASRAQEAHPAARHRGV